MKNLIKAVSVLCLVFAVAACNKKNTSEDIITGENLAAPTTVEVVVEETPVVVEIRNTEIALGTVTFALDKYNLSAAAKKILEANAAVIKSRAAQGFILTVEGNCDERGTISYNIALGEKRASEVKKYYVQLGVSAASISTVSYGKEKPVCYEAAESCYAKNRRADSVLLVK